MRKKVLVKKNIDSERAEAGGLQPADQRPACPNPQQSRDVGPDLAASIWQLVSTILPFCGLAYLMYLTLPVSYYLTLAIGVVAAGFMVRIFIIQHDCGHWSYFKSRRANDWVGLLCSLFTMVPYAYWRKQHALHHATSGNLDRRGLGDVTVYTVDEYLRLNKWDRFKYRIYRNPVVFFLFGPAALYLVNNRIAPDKEHSTRQERINVLFTNLAIAAIVVSFGLWIGFAKFLLIAAPILMVAGGAGIWIFYIQHQFEHVYWRRDPEWNLKHSALQGSSYFRLPRILQWFTGNIGFHHVHHSRVSIPNYRLERVFKENPEYHEVYVVTLWSSIRHMFLSVWDEAQDRLVSFREVARIERMRAEAQ